MASRPNEARLVGLYSIGNSKLVPPQWNHQGEKFVSVAFRSKGSPV